MELKISKPKIIEYLTTPGCFLFFWLPVIVFFVVQSEFRYQTFLETGSFFPSIRSPYYLIFTDSSRDFSILDHPGSFGSEFGRGKQGQKLEIIGFVGKGFLHSVVVTFNGKTGFVKWYGQGHQITCTNENTNNKGSRACIWGIKTQLTEYDYDSGLPKEDR